MNLIVFDLEWNIGYKPKMFEYHGFEQVLRGEIIQIGAVKIDEDANVLDTFRINLKPRIFRKLQYRIAKVTGLTQWDLDNGIAMKEGMQRFVDWAGKDAQFAEWGLDDVPVLKQNLYLLGMDESWPTVWYDLQRIFTEQFPRGEGEGMTLESVITRLEIPTDRPFHDALSDALYTVDVARKLDLRAGIAAYPTEEETLLESLCPEGEGEYSNVTWFTGYLDRDAFRNDSALYEVACPECGYTLRPEEFWGKRGNTGYFSMAVCPQHGQRFIRFKLARRDGLHWTFGRCLQRPGAEALARYEKQKKQALARAQRRAAEEAATESETN